VVSDLRARAKNPRELGPGVPRDRALTLTIRQGLASFSMNDLTVGAVAARTGVTVRTLHHYDHIGLLSPSGRTDAGYRVYRESDIRRLETIALLRSLGLSLVEVATALDQDADALLQLLEQRRELVQTRLEDARRLMVRLDHMAERLRTHSP